MSHNQFVHGASYLSAELRDGEELLQRHIVVSVKRLESILDPVDSVIVPRATDQSITLFRRVCEIFKLLRTSD